LKEDPTEMHNVYNDRKYAGVRKQMHAILKKQQKLYDDNIENEIKH
ncbi:MAG: DUF4976 domain-containing protein, partial [Bacteroidaceae bacterium]|nr:DUF4976 domain-containing protein [Bacteroidaceae bacterium]